MPAQNKKPEKTRPVETILYTFPATVCLDGLVTKDQMLDFIARATDGIAVRTSDGIAMFLKI